MNFKLFVANSAALLFVTAAVAAPPLPEGTRGLQSGAQTQRTCVGDDCDHDRLPNQGPVEQDSAPTGDATPDANAGADTPASHGHTLPGSDVAAAGGGATAEVGASIGAAGGVAGAPVATQGSLPGAGGKKKGAPVRVNETGAIHQN
jgi:hypothetical protein